MRPQSASLLDFSKMASKLPKDPHTLRQLLFAHTLYLADPSIRDKLTWVPYDNCKHLVMKGNEWNTIEDAATNPRVVVGAPKDADLTIVVRLAKNSNFLAHDGNWRLGNPYTHNFADVSLSAYVENSMLVPFDADYSTALTTLEGLFDTAKEEGQFSFNFFVMKNEMKRFRIKHILFFVSYTYYSVFDV